MFLSCITRELELHGFRDHSRTSLIDERTAERGLTDREPPPTFIEVSRERFSMGELETEAQKTRGEIASYLRELADQLDGDGDVIFELGGKQVVLNPTEPVTLKLEGESDWSQGDTEAKQSIEIELVWWREAASQNDSALNIMNEET